MTQTCPELHDRLAPYVDGELDAAAAEVYGLHLASCEVCRAGLHDALQLAALEARASGTPVARTVPPRAPRERARRWNRRSRVIAAITAALVVIVVAIGLVGRRGGGSDPLVLAIAPARTLEGRVAYAAADRYRPYRVARAGAPATPDAIGLATLARLEDRGDLHGVAAAYLLRGEPTQAATYLERAAAGPDVAADRGLALLAAGHPADALIALGAVLETSPHHPQALWNRALALRDLGLTLMAIEAFTAVAALGEPGWSDEARARARALTEQTDERKRLHDRVLAAGPRLAAAPDGISPDLARRIPGSARIFFYDAVRSATSPDAVRALAPLARALDAIAGDDSLAAYLERTERADFLRRGPLAARYARVVAGESLDPAATRDLLADLRAARQDDILLGALLLTGPDRRTVPPALLPEFRRLAEASGEPWSHLLAVEQEAGALVSRGELENAETLALGALSSCTTSRLDYRCMRLAIVVGEIYLQTLRLSDARRVLSDGLMRSRRSGEWLIEQQFLPLLADLEMLADDVSATTFPLAHAYLGELVRRDPRCTTEKWSHDEVAAILLDRGDLEGVRRELQRAAAGAAACSEATPTLQGLFARAHVARDEEVSAVRAEIAQLRADPAFMPGEQAILDLTEGMLLIDLSATGTVSSMRDPAAGRALLERAVKESGQIHHADANAHKARAYAFSLLTLDAGRAGDWQRVWQLLEDEASPTRARCALGVASEGPRSVVVVRDGAGEVAGAYDAARATPERDAFHLIPVALRDRLRGCQEVDVIARPPVEGSPALLPIELAWSYHSATTRPQPAPSKGPRLVIANTEPPAELGLARLFPWRSAAGSAAVMLEGPAATPSKTLAALADAGFVEIHAHGMVNAAISDASFLMLSPDGDGRYALTAAAIRKQPLRGRPVVILAACHAGATASYRHEPWGLPAAFIEAGARAVIASPDVIADADAGAFFDAVRTRIERGTSPALALHDVRLEWLSAHPDAVWVRSLMVFR